MNINELMAVMEARKKEATIDVKGEKPKDNDDDLEEDVPTADEDPPEEEDENPDEGNEEEPQEDDDTPEEAPDADDAEGEPEEAPNADDTDEPPTAEDNPPAENEDTAGDEPPAAEGEDEGTPEEAPDAEGDAPEEGGDTDEPPTAEDNEGDAEAEGGEEAPPDADENAEDNPDEEGNDTGDDNDISASSDMDNGDDPAALAEADKKNNIIHLRTNFITLYKDIINFKDRIDDAEKSNALVTATYRQVKENLAKLAESVFIYIVRYFDNTDYDINLFNYNQIIQIIRINLEMVKKAKNTIDKNDETSKK